MTPERLRLLRATEVIVDVVGHDERDAEQLLALRGHVGGLIAISSVSVYADAQGHTIDEEWWVVGRARDRRPYIVLAHAGGSTFHPTSTRNLAQLVRLAAERPGTRVLNCGVPTRRACATSSGRWSRPSTTTSRGAAAVVWQRPPTPSSATSWRTNSYTTSPQARTDKATTEADVMPGRVKSSAPPRRPPRARLGRPAGGRDPAPGGAGRYWPSSPSTTSASPPPLPSPTRSASTESSWNSPASDSR